MELVQPSVYHVAQTRILDSDNQHRDLGAYLEDLGVPGWQTNAVSHGELLVEVAGKLCYRSFDAFLNDNLTTVRENNNHGYIGNILKQRHGAVLEHVHDTFILKDVSRVFTHELVRHRLANYSQESLRFVRLTHLKAYFPRVFQKDFLAELNSHLVNKGRDELTLQESDMLELFCSTLERLEDVQVQLAEVLRLDELSFDLKKKLTSAMRRLAPIGLATTIMITTNARMWRHLIQLRTSRHAEEEIRLVFNQIYDQLWAYYPAIYQDSRAEVIDGLREITFDNFEEKV